MALNQTAAALPFRRPPNLQSVTRVPSTEQYAFMKHTDGRRWIDPFAGRRQLLTKNWQEPTRDMLIAPPKSVYVIRHGEKRSVRSGRSMPPIEFFDQSEDANEINVKSKKHGRRIKQPQVYHEFEDDYDNDMPDDEQPEPVIDFRKEDSQFVTAVPNIPPALYSYIIGKKGLTRRNIESQTSTRLQIPTKELSMDASQRHILVFGDDRTSVIRAYRAVIAAAVRARKMISPSHFISVPITPLSSGNTVDRFLNFKQKVLEDFGVVCKLGDSNFVDSNKLHITICMALLLTKDECDAAKAVFDRVCRKTVTGYQPQIAIRGLDIMNDDPSACSIVYAKVRSANDLLQELAANFSTAFQRRNFIAGKGNYSDDAVDGGGIKLHVTLMRARRRNAATNDSDIDDLPPELGDGDGGDAGGGADEITDVPSANSAEVERDVELSHIGIDPATGKARAMEKSSFADTSNRKASGSPTRNQSRGISRKGGRPVMDIRPVLAKYGDYDFGVTTFDAVHLSVRMTTDPKTLYYKSLATYELASAGEREGRDGNDKDEEAEFSASAGAAASATKGALVSSAIRDVEGDDQVDEDDAEDAQLDTADDRDYDATYDDAGPECG